MRGRINPLVCYLQAEKVIQIEIYQLENMKREKLEQLAFENSSPCVTISMNTHRTSPENLEDIAGLKNLLNEARDRVVDEYNDRPVIDLLEKIDNLEKEIDVNYNLESLHLFLSNSTKEIVRSSWPVLRNSVHISGNFFYHLYCTFSIFQNFLRFNSRYIRKEPPATRIHKHSELLHFKKICCSSQFSLL